MGLGRAILGAELAGVEFNVKVLSRQHGSTPLQGIKL